MRFKFFAAFLTGLIFLSAQDIEPLCYRNRLFQLELVRSVLKDYQQQFRLSNITGEQFLDYEKWGAAEIRRINVFYDELAARAKTTNEMIAERNKFKYQRVYTIDKGKLEADFHNRVLDRAEYERRITALKKDVLQEMGELTGEKVAASAYYISGYIILFAVFVIAALWYYNRGRKPPHPVQDCPVCGEKKSVDRMLIGVNYYDICRYCSYKKALKSEKRS